MSSNRYEINGYTLELIRDRNETRMIALMREILPGLQDFCNCRVCVEDVYAAAMSDLPGSYAQKETIVLQQKLLDSDLKAKLSEAVEKVSANPNHAVGIKRAGQEKSG